MSEENFQMLFDEIHTQSNDLDRKTDKTVNTILLKTDYFIKIGLIFTYIAPQTEAERAEN